MSVKRLRAWHWLRQSHVPVAPGLRLRQGGYDYGGTLGKTSSYIGNGVIAWEGPLASEQDRHDLYHEAGHAFLREYKCTPADCARIAHLAGFNAHTPWWWGDMKDPNPATAKRQPLDENFADLYATLARHPQGYPALRGFLTEIANRGGP